MIFLSDVQTWLLQCVIVNSHQQLAATSVQLRLKHQDLSLRIFPRGRTSSQRDVCSLDGFADPQQVFLGLHPDWVFPADCAHTVGCCRSLQLELWREPRLLLSRRVRIPPRKRFMERLFLLQDIWDRRVMWSISLTCSSGSVRSGA